MDRMDVIVTTLATVLLAFVVFIMGGNYARNHIEEQNKINHIKNEI